MASFAGFKQDNELRRNFQGTNPEFQTNLVYLSKGQFFEHLGGFLLACVLQHLLKLINQNLLMSQAL